jgi:toxin FitB
MVILDTNIISEALKPSPSPDVIQWLRSQHAASVHTTAITIAEILQGVEMLPAGRRRKALQNAVALALNEFSGRVLPFDVEAAAVYARLVAHRQGQGRPLAPLDGIIAAIALTHKATLATRNVKDFAGCGLRLANPWAD